MTDNEKLKARLENTEKALCALATVIGDHFAPATAVGDYFSDKIHNDIDTLINAYFDANTSLGFVPSVEFKSIEEVL